MARCAECRKIILLGGVREGSRRFCGEDCRVRHRTTVSHELPEGVVRQEVFEIHAGPCPLCGGPGPVDVHSTSYVVSAILFCYSGVQQVIACRRCGRRRQASRVALKLLLGWWSFEGLFLTPMYLVVDAFRILRPRDHRLPSQALFDHVRSDLGERILEYEAELRNESGR